MNPRAAAMRRHTLRHAWRRCAQRLYRRRTPRSGRRRLRGVPARGQRVLQGGRVAWHPGAGIDRVPAIPANGTRRASTSPRRTAGNRFREKEAGSMRRQNRPGTPFATTALLLAAVAPIFAAPASAQISLHFSAGFGFGGGGYHQPLFATPLHCQESFLLDDPFDPGYGSGTLYHDPFPGPLFGHGSLFANCHHYIAVGFPAYAPYGYGWAPYGHGWFGPARFGFGFPGWSLRRHIRSHFRYATFGIGFHSRDWGWGRGWGWEYRHRHAYHPYDRGYYGWHPYQGGYRSRDRVVRRSPLYGPRFKEYPAPIYVTDNGPERPVSRAVPRSAQPRGTADAGRTDDGSASVRGVRSARPRGGSGAATAPPTRPPTRTARPRGAEDTRTADPPRVRARPRNEPAQAGRRPERTRTPPSAKPAPGRPTPPTVRPAPAPKPATPPVRRTPSRRGATPEARPVPSRPPAARPATPTRRAAPKVRPATPGARSTPATKPQARSRPKSPSRPVVRPAPRSRGTSPPKPPTRRPPRRPPPGLW